MHYVFGPFVCPDTQRTDTVATISLERLE